MLFGDLLRVLGFRGRPKAVRGAHGWSKTTGPYGEVVWCDTLTCCHCQATWEYVQGSGRQRGFCSRCFDGRNPVTGYTCGAPACMVCVHFEQRLANVEAGRPELYVPPAPVLVTAEPPKADPPRPILPGG